ncbi:hypothetical protein MMC24_006263 [Lignoscripta atroalba]|nr:hypothetical protein [Lignoscripta atroalba]
MAQTFEYMPLDIATNEIRLLRISSAAESLDIQCSLVHISLNDPPLYFTLSYAWEEPTLYHNSSSESGPRITVNGVSCEVGHNLAAALRYSRSQRFVALWVDAICIDQTNLEERGEQVLRIRSIYEKAQTVIVWLGCEAQDSKDALEFIELIAQQYDNPDASSWLRKVVTERTHSHAWRALRDLLERSWWTRVWVVQETSAAATIEAVCGDYRVSWESLIRFAEVLSWCFHEIGLLLRNLEGLDMNYVSLNGLYCHHRIRSRLASGEALKIMGMLELTRYCNSTDDRDKLYGILGLVQDVTIANPTYRIPSHEVFRDLARSWIEAYKSLDIISMDAPRRQDIQLPSWTPDFGSNVQGRIAINYGRSYAAKETVSAVEFSSSDTILSCQGVCVDEIDGLGFDPWGANQADKSIVQPRHRNSVYKSENSTFSALWRTTVADAKRHNFGHVEAPGYFGQLFTKHCRKAESLLGAPPDEGVLRPHRPGAPEFEKWYQANRNMAIADGRTIRAWILVQPSIDDYTLEEEWGVDAEARDSFELTSFQMKWHRRLITTRKGYIGIAPRQVRQGDKVCVLWGCCTPLVLRPVEGRYLCIGECNLTVS